MPHLERRAGEAGGARAGKIVLGAAVGKMQHAVDRAFVQRRDERGRIRRGDRAIDDAHLGGDAVRGEFADQIGGAVLAGKIKQRRVGVGMALGDELDQVAHVAAGGGDLRETGGAARPRRCGGRRHKAAT